MMTTKTHWETVYAAKAETEVSWFQEHSAVSLDLIERSAIARSSPIIDVGGGASRLVEDLLAAGFENLTVLDVSDAALTMAQARLGRKTASVQWMASDITEASLPFQHFSLWHDRAVFHFLTRETDRQKYVRQVCHAVAPGGHVIVSTFAPDGPLQCSGLAVMRYSPDSLHAEFGNAFTLLEHEQETHQTPFGTEQRFIYCYCRKI